MVWSNSSYVRGKNNEYRRRRHYQRLDRIAVRVQGADDRKVFLVGRAAWQTEFIELAKMPAKAQARMPEATR